MKGFYSQGVAILTSAPIALSELQSFAPDRIFSREFPAGKELWVGGQSVILDYLPEVNGRVQIDVVPRPWPDHMGDPKTDPMLFGSWSMGHFGPFAYPNGLFRALQQAWTWPAAKERVPTHTSFVRFRMSYVFGGGPDAPCLPNSYDPKAELDFLVALVRPLLKHPNAICYFNPNGEVLADFATMSEALAYDLDHRLPSLGLWTNIRLYDATPEWHLMDTVGLSQLDLPDIEAIFPRGAFSPPDLDNFLRNASAYILQKGDVIEHGHTMNGPGDRNWRAHRFKTPLTDPPRPVICFVPEGVDSPPAHFLSRVENSGRTTSPSVKKKRWWSFGRS